MNSGRRLVCLRTGYGKAGFSSKVQTRTFLHFVLSCSVFFRCGANFLRSWAAELEVAATQTLEFADEVFCSAEVPALQGVLSARSTQSASSALLLRSCLSQTEQSGKSAPLGAKTGQPKLLQRGRKIASVSKSGRKRNPGFSNLRSD